MEGGGWGEGKRMGGERRRDEEETCSSVIKDAHFLCEFFQY